MINLSRVVRSRKLNSQAFTIVRSSGSFVGGRWVEGTETEIDVVGVVSVVNNKEKAQMPEADRVKAAMRFITTTEVKVTHADDEQGISDKIVWRGGTYKIFQVAPWIDYGFYEAVGERMEGN